MKCTYPLFLLVGVCSVCGGRVFCMPYFVSSRNDRLFTHDAVHFYQKKQEYIHKTKEKAVAFPITEVVTNNEFFDYDAKYNGQVEEITPARIPNEMRQEVQELTLKIYDILGCKGIIRVDYIITKNEKQKRQINLLEVNTTPGMTETSFIPQQVKAAGLKIGEVMSQIIENEIR